MNVDDYSEAEWQDILDEFRLLVVRAGYTEWDAATIEVIFEGYEDGDGSRFDRTPTPPPVEQLRRYVTAFMRYLKARSRYARDERRAQLTDLLRTEAGTPVDDFLVDFDGRERSIFEIDDDPDAMIELLGRFLDELNGEDGRFWNDSPKGGF